MVKRFGFFRLFVGIILLVTLFSLGRISPSYASGFNVPLQLTSSASLLNNINLPTPSWWSGTCDVNNNPGSSPLGSSYRGMPTCGPFPNVHPDHPVYFPKGDTVQVNEWECTELAMRYLYLAYGQHPYVAGGGQVVSNYPGTLLHQFSNVTGSGNAPHIGDIISSNTTDINGHVVVVQTEDPTVQTTGTGNITVIDENGIAGAGGIETYHDSNWLIDSGVTGWLHPNTLVASANPISNENGLRAVATVIATNNYQNEIANVWAVGHTLLQSGIDQALVEHWDGESWIANNPAPPNLGTGNNDLYGVAVLSKNNIWAVGYYDDSNGTETLLEHYNGKSWTAQTIGGGYLFAITKVSSSEAWAVGLDNSGNALTVHLLNGTWTTVPNPATATDLWGVSAVSASNVMAVGYSQSQTQTVALQWNGTSWTPTNPPPPNPTPGQTNRLFAVYALNATHIYAVGDTSSNNTSGFVTTWNGSSWSNPVLVPSSISTLSSVYALSSKNVWAVGQYGANGILNTLVFHYNGSSWSQISSPNGPGSISNQLLGVTINTQNGNVWAVGSTGTTGGLSTLTEFFN
jgi:hypothetical protein